MNESTPRPAETDVQPGASHGTPSSVCIDWYAEGHSRTVEVDGVQITVRFIGRKGRRGRIAIEAPAGALFAAWDGDKPKRA